MKFIKNIKFLFSYSWSIDKQRIGAAGINIAFNTIEPFIYLLFPRFIIDELVNQRDWNKVLLLISLFVGSILIFRALRIIFNVYINLSINRSDVKNGISYAQHFLKMDYEKLEDSKIRDLQQQVSSNVRENSFIETVEGFLTSLFTLAGYAYIIITLEPNVLVIIIMVVLLHYSINKKISKNSYEYQPILARFTRFFDYLFDTMTTFDFAKEVRINKADNILKKKFDNTIYKYEKENKNFLRKQLIMNILTDILSVIQILVSYGYAAYSAIVGKITIGSFNMYIGAIYNISDSINKLIAQCINLSYLSKYVNDYNSYIQVAFPQNEDKEKNSLPAENSEYPMFEFDNVSFTYPNTQKKVLDHISIKIYKGEKLSIVGLNGAGKTTFIKLLCRLYKPTEGTIRYYGTDIWTIKRSEYLSLLSVVFQDFKIFSFTFLDNIILNQKLDEFKLQKSIINVGLGSKLKSLPNGMSTNINKDFDEQGIEFSGGEGQKLAIARAYYKESSLDILDEPTAALDALAEYEIYQKFNEIIENKTAIFISHRLASAKFCDNIAVFQNGKIIEYGCHNELIKKNGLYSEMFKKQAHYYIDEGELSYEP